MHYRYTVMSSLDVLLYGGSDLTAAARATGLEDARPYIHDSLYVGDMPVAWNAGQYYIGERGQTLASLRGMLFRDEP